MRYFRDMVVLAEGFLRSTEPPVRRFGVELYTLLFSEFHDKILRQVFTTLSILSFYFSSNLINLSKGYFRKSCNTYWSIRRRN